jgi:histidinol-phosphate aminotransferase
MSLVRRQVERMSGYVPGEQPKVAGLIKLNTNENPYPPSPKVLEAIRGAIDGKATVVSRPDVVRVAREAGQDLRL